jgi:adenine-specific DNA-methyltransferase
VIDDDVELRWPGKYEPDGSRARLPTTGAALRERERFGAPVAGEAWVDTLVLGDNLLVLEALVRERPGSVDLVYIDPPFATGNAFALARKLPDSAELRLPAFDDAWTDGVAGFLRMLDPRLRLIHALLSPRGSLYVHVDPTVGHAVKLLLDEIFGRASFQREIVWRIGWVSGFKTRARNWIRNHDLIFFYTKHPSEFTFHKTWVPRPAGYQRRDGAPAKSPGIAIDDVWNAGTAELELTGYESLDSIQIKSFSKEKTGWATQKNESLLRRIIAASSNPGDVVVDVFGGSGTTAAVAHGLGRKFLVADHSESAVQIARDRLLDAGVEQLRVCELDEAERRVAVAQAGASLVEWMLAQLEAEAWVGPGGIVGRRGDVGVALGMPGLAIDLVRVATLRAAAHAAGLRSVELLAFDWSDALSRVEIEADPSESSTPSDSSTFSTVDDAPELIPLQVGRGLWQASIRATPWLRGGVGVWERPRVRVALVDGCLHWRSITVRRPECVPEPLRGHDAFAALLAWSLIDDAGRVHFSARRRAQALARSSDAMPSFESLRLAFDDIRGHRCVLGLNPVRRRE